MNLFFQFIWFILLSLLFTSVILGVVKIGGPWTWSIKVHILMEQVHGPGPQRGSLDQGYMCCTIPIDHFSCLLGDWAIEW